MRRLLPVLLAAACGQPAPKTGDTTAGPAAPTYPLTDAPYTALQATWRPLGPNATTAAAIAAGTLQVTDLVEMLDAGLGVSLDAGVPWVERIELAPDFRPGDPDQRRSLLYAWQAADPQLIDEESPIRFEAFEALYRPQGHLTVQVFESHVRTARRISDLSGRPFDVALFAGDLTDGSQLNEAQWFVDALHGGDLDPDSGEDDDPVPGPGNDYNDPFHSDGIGVPWVAVLGNHETQYNGGFGPIDDTLIAAATGDTVYVSDLFDNGYRDGATPTAEVVVDGTLPPDPDRTPLDLLGWLDLLFHAPGDPAGHGLTAEGVAAGEGWFSVAPVAGKPLRLVCLDTVNPTGVIAAGAKGWVSEDQLRWLQSELGEAESNGEVVVVMGHHRVQDFGGDSPATGDAVAAALASSPAVVVYVTGHGHHNTIDHQTGGLADATDGFWQVMLASTVDFPMQSRIIELVDEGNGFLTIYLTNLGHNAPTDSLAHQGRALAAAALSFGGFHGTDDVDALWEEDRAAQNLALRVPLSAAQQAALAAHDWPDQIESEATLLRLDGP